MPVDWDYSDVADAYDARPGYAPSVLSACLDVVAKCGARGAACDIGAGTGRLTLALLDRGYPVVAVEPNRAMRARGVSATAECAAVTWVAACGETLPFRSGAFRLVTFGSSLNVVDQDVALPEAGRVLQPGGWIFCVWNHRRLDDPLQARIEALIRTRLPSYTYGTRRDDPTAAIAASGLFDRIERLEDTVTHRSTIASTRLAWRSHLTLRRQAGAAFDAILVAIDAELARAATPEIAVPYVTRAWLARRG